jgi:GDPmannose 4,6-dehydratase
MGNNKKRALITGVAGQDGSYLAEYLLENDYDVFGIVRYSTTDSAMNNLKNCKNDIELIESDIQDSTSIRSVIRDVRPHEVYNLAAQSHVGKSFDMPIYTSNVTANSVLVMLDAIRDSNFVTKFYQASTSELFGEVLETPQNENTRFNPRSPYAVSKLYAHYMVKTYRAAYNMFACSGILFNHESPRRGPNFVTQKVCRAAVEISRGNQKNVELGNIDAKRDWGHAKDYVRGMHMILQHRIPDDFVLSTGETRSIRDLLSTAFSYLDLDYRDHYIINPKFYRPADVNFLVGDCTKAKSELGWEHKIGFDDMIHEMIDIYISDTKSGQS